ncbi:hypothetical protein, partial [Pseudomonas gingeri]
MVMESAHRVFVLWRAPGKLGRKGWWIIADEPAESGSLDDRGPHGGFAGRFGALAVVSMEGALASLPAFGGLFSEVGEGSAGAAEGGAAGASEGVAGGSSASSSEELDVGSSSGGAKGAASEGLKTTNNSLPTNSSQLSHIFRDDVGHLADNPENQRALVNLTNNPANSLGTDRFGNQWFSQLRSDGTQLWGSVRNGVIQNGGLNKTPRDFNPATGLSKGK